MLLQHLIMISRDWEQHKKWQEVPTEMHNRDGVGMMEPGVVSQN